MEKFRYNGKNYRTVATMGVLRTFRELTGYDISELAQKRDSTAPAAFLWAAITTASRIDGAEFGVSFDEFCDRVDIKECNAWFLTNFVEAPGESDKKK